MGLIRTVTTLHLAPACAPRRLSRSGRALLLGGLLEFAAMGWSQPAVRPQAAGSGPGSTLPVQQAAEDAMPGSIGGVVEGRDGAVYQGAHIALDVTAGLEPSERTTTSDSDGRFSFTGVPAGAFKLTVSAQGFSSKSVSGVLASGQSYDAWAIVLALDATSSEVRVNASREEIAEEQLKAEETQRVFGVIPNFYVSYVPNAPPLTSRQKFNLAWKASIDPITFIETAAFAGVEQAENTYSGLGQGAQGYAKRYGANYADNFIGTMLGSALLPSVFKQDPRYFYKGAGTVRSRVLYAIANAVICKGDNGRWQANYSGILGNLAAGGISNLYYPAANRDGVGLTFENAGLGAAAGAVQNLFQEFVVKRLTPKIPNYGPAQP